MAELRPVPFEALLRRALVEPARSGTLFDLPLRKAWRPAAGRDLSVDVHGHRAQTPLGPAAGPHAQLAQNIVLSWLGGARVIELKTVQILDELQIPRPCIDAATVGYNVEWSQELRLEQSLEEYVAGWYLTAIVNALDPVGLGEAAAAAHPVFELSVGYDHAGLTSPKMRAYLLAAKDVAARVDALRARVPAGEARLRDLPVPSQMVSCVTLSTFHGCPPEQIEAIGRYLLEEIDVDVIVKLNPTLLGWDEVSYLLHDRMGYHDIRPRRAAFDGDLRWEDAVALGDRLARVAEARGRSFGVKMTNTLVVENHKRFFPESQKEMYLSGPPLHVLAMHCVERWRAAFGARVPLSFSGGIDQHNFADAVACDLVPVTTCTDLLRPGGYGRLSRYLGNLEAAMAEHGAADRDAFVLKRFGKGPEAVRLVLAELREEDARREPLLDELEPLLDAAARGDGALAPVVAGFVAARPEAAALGDLARRIVQAAGVLNSHEVTAHVTGDPRYAAGKNAKPPRKVGSKLVLLDCLSCDKCVPVCPNDANFEVPTPAEEVACVDLLLAEDGTISRAPAPPWQVREGAQWANYADACNECGNCDVFCPEDGGPYVVKARFFGTLASFEASPAHDGFFVAPTDGGLAIDVRHQGRRYRVTIDADGSARVETEALVARYDATDARLLDAEKRPHAAGPAHLPGVIFPMTRALVRGALSRVNMISAQLDRPWPTTSGPTPNGPTTTEPTPNPGTSPNVSRPSST